MAGTSPRASRTTSNTTPRASAGAHPRRVEIHGDERLNRAMLSLSDADSMADHYAADIQALSRSARLLMAATSHREQREAGLLILSELLPQVAAQMARKVEELAREAGAAVLEAHERDTVRGGL